MNWLIRTKVKLTIALIICILTVTILWLCGYDLYDWSLYAGIVLVSEVVVHFAYNHIMHNKQSSHERTACKP